MIFLQGLEDKIVPANQAQMMVNALKLSIPLKVDTKIGKNWGEMEK